MSPTTGVTNPDQPGRWRERISAMITAGSPPQGTTYWPPSSVTRAHRLARSSAVTAPAVQDGAVRQRVTATSFTTSHRDATTTARARAARASGGCPQPFGPSAAADVYRAACLQHSPPSRSPPPRCRRVHACGPHGLATSSTLRRRTAAPRTVAPARSSRITTVSSRKTDRGSHRRRVPPGPPARRQPAVRHRPRAGTGPVPYPAPQALGR